HEALYFVVPIATSAGVDIGELVKKCHPDEPFAPKRTTGLFDYSKAERVLGWKHP
ncbi:hypothetical protein PENSPDRAFT_547931, partial [Peniophora sp. CONT]